MKALLAILLVCCLALAGVAMYAAQEAPAFIGSMHLGDEWAYENQDGEVTTFSWSGREYTLAEDGRQVYANRLSFFDERSHESFFFADTLAPVSHKYNYKVTHGNGNMVSAMALTKWNQAQDCMTQGSLGNELTFENCSPFVGNATLQRVSTWTYEGTSSKGPIMIQYTEGIPYPTVISYISKGETFTETLTGFVPGKTPLQTQALDSIGGFTHIESALQPWGPDMPPSEDFTLRTAYEQAVLAGHFPEDLQLMGARPFQSTLGSQQRESWDLLTEYGLTLQVQKEQTQAQGILFPQTTEYHFHWKQSQEEVPKTLPETFPTKSSLTQEYHHFGGQLESPLVGFRLDEGTYETFAGAYDYRTAYGAEHYVFTDNDASASWLRGGESKLMYQYERQESLTPAPPANTQPLSAPDTVSPIAPAAGAGIVGLLIGIKIFALFSRQLKPHKHRHAMQELVQQSPGIHFQAIRKELGLATGTAEHHLEKMVQEGHLQTTRQGRKRCYFPAGTPLLTMQQQSALYEEAIRNLYESIQGTMTLQEAATAANLHRNAASRYLKILESCQLIDLEKQGRSLAVSRRKQ